MGNPSKRKQGAALVESCLVIIMLCLILFGILQVSYLIMSRDVISFSAFASARALTVGMNEEFVERVARVTTIPTAGPMASKGLDLGQGLGGNTMGDQWDRAVQNSPDSEQFWVEHYLIPYYLGAEDESQLDHILNYYNWVGSDTEVSTQSSSAGDDEAEVTVSQHVPLVFPFAGAYFRGARGHVVRMGEGGGYVYQEVPMHLIEQTIRLENHSQLYLTDE